jgi:hypothetical protein
MHQRGNLVYVFRIDDKQITWEIIATEKLLEQL